MRVDMDVDGIVALVGKVVRTCTLNQDEQVQVLKLSAGLQKLLADVFDDTVLEHHNTPMLTAYISDGWARVVSDTWCRTIDFDGSHVRICRNGKVRHEFLLQRQLLRCDTFDGNELIKLAMCEPIGLKLGARAVNVFTAACEFRGTLRQGGHFGLCWNVYIQDGLLHSALTRLFLARHELYYRSGIDLGHLAEQLRDTDLTITIRCPSHSCSNSLEKGFRVIDDKKKVVDELHIVTASFINGSSQLYEGLEAWVFHRLRFVSEPTGTIEQRAAFWSHFVDDVAFVDLLVTYDLRFEHDLLIASTAAATLSDPFKAIADVLLYLFRWTKFIETRWCACGQSCRYLFRGYAGGVEQLAVHVLAGENAVQHHLGGVRRATLQVKLLAAVAALCSGPAEKLLAAMFDDERFLLKAVEYRAILDDEVTYLLELDPYVWARISGLIAPSFDADELIHLTLKATFVSVGYIWYMLFKQLLERPLALTQGDIAANIEALMGANLEELDVVSAKIRRAIGTHGVYRSYIEISLKLLAKTPCTTNLVEQGHGVGATIMKHHERLHELALKARAVVSSAKTLVFPSKHVKKLNALESKIAAAQRVVNGPTPWNLFVAKQSAATCEEVARDLPHARRAARLQEKNLRLHAEFRALPPAERRRLEVASVYAIRERVADRARDLDSLRAMVALEKQRHASELAEFGLGSHLQDLALTPNELTRLCGIYNSFEGKSAELTKRTFEAPKPLSDTELEMFEQIAAELLPKKVEPPIWLSCVCQHRDALDGAAFFIDDSIDAWALLYASQRPYFAVFMRLMRRDVILPAIEEMTPLEAVGANWDDRREYEFTSPLEFACEQVVPFAATLDFKLLRGLRYCQWGAYTEILPETFCCFRVDHPPPQRAGTGERVARPRVDRASAEVVLRREFPWLSDEDIARALGKRAPPRKALPRERVAGSDVDADSSAASDHSDRESVDDDADSDEGLEAIRDEWHFEADRFDAYRSRIVGRDYVKKHSGVEASCQKGYARTEFVKSWADKYTWPREKNYFFSVYELEGATKLVGEFCRRSNHYHNVAFAADGDHWYTEDDRVEEDLDFLNWMLSLDVGHPCYVAASKLRELFPVNP